MAGGQLSPRQKMINMMYLVLTALLAMNVSKEVLLAFRSIETGIENSNAVVTDKITFLTSVLEGQASDNAKAVPLLGLAKEVSTESASLIALIKEIKTALLSDKFAGENEDNPGTVKKLSDIDSPTRLLADETKKETFRGIELQDKINNTKKAFLAILGKVDKIKPEEIAKLEQSFTLSADDFEKGERDRTQWYSQFFHVPATGAMTMLTKIESDVLNTEAIVTEFLLNRVSATDFKFDKLRATIQAEKAYLPGGAQYESNIFLTASSSGIVAETFVGNLDWSLFEKDSLGDFKPWNDVEAKMEGKHPFKGDLPKEVVGGKLTRGTSVGQNSYAGAIKISNPVGGYDWYPFKGSYEGAAAGGFSASPTKMNLLYIGVPNPMSITIGDAKPGTERVSLSGGGSISKSGNSWVAKVKKQGKVTLSASGTTPDGKPTKTFTAEFRVKRIPDPVPTLGGKYNGGNIKKGTLAAQRGVIALLKDFEFDAKFTVVSYNFMLVSKGEIFPDRGVKGPSISGKSKNLLKRARPKDIVIFDKIKVRGPDGTTRTIPSLTFTIV